MAEVDVEADAESEFVGESDFTEADFPLENQLLLGHESWKHQLFSQASVRCLKVLKIL